MKPRILLATPTYDGSVTYFQKPALQGAITDGSCELMDSPYQSSLLGQSFNSPFADALNMRETHGITHFGMMHADIFPKQMNWLSILVAELEREKTGMVSAIIAVKDYRRVTSTGFYPKSVQGNFDQSKVELLKIADLAKLPKTFTAESVGRPEDYLILNTGLWVMDIRQPWIDEKPYLHFEVKSWIDKVDGKYMALWLPEDWNFSMQLQRKGVKVCATQKVTCKHKGYFWYDTD